VSFRLLALRRLNRTERRSRSWRAEFICAASPKPRSFRPPPGAGTRAWGRICLASATRSISSICSRRALLDRALRAVRDVVAPAGACCRRHSAAAEYVAESAKRCGQYYVPPLARRMLTTGRRSRQHQAAAPDRRHALRTPGPDKKEVLDITRDRRSWNARSRHQGHGRAARHPVHIDTNKEKAAVEEPQAGIRWSRCSTELRPVGVTYRSRATTTPSEITLYALMRPVWMHPPRDRSGHIAARGMPPETLPGSNAPAHCLSTNTGETNARSRPAGKGSGERTGAAFSTARSRHRVRWRHGGAMTGCARRHVRRQEVGPYRRRGLIGVSRDRGAMVESTPRPPVAATRLQAFAEVARSA